MIFLTCDVRLLVRKVRESNQADHVIETARMCRLICAIVVTNSEDSFSQSQSNCSSFYHERLESKMRNFIFVKYNITQTELLLVQSLQSICSLFVDTPRVILLVTVFFIIQSDIRK